MAEKLERNIKPLNDDPKHYPGDNPAGYFTTVDITRCLDLKMETLQAWIKQGFVHPAYIVEGGRGGKKFFTKSQVAIIAVFERFVSFGVSRKLADVWARRFHNERFNQKQKNGDSSEPHFIVLEVEGREVNKLHILPSDVRIKSKNNTKDYVVIDFALILGKIEQYLG